jgi:arginyl-tRNA synthetase
MNTPQSNLNRLNKSSTFNNHVETITHALQTYLNQLSDSNKMNADQADAVSYANTIAAALAAVKIEVTPPKQLNHGDYTTNLAMHLTRILKKPPIKIAEEIILFLQNDEDVSQNIEKYEIAGPGFINLHLNQYAKTTVLKSHFRICFSQSNGAFAYWSRSSSGFR